MVDDLHFTLAAYERLIRTDKLNVKALCDVGLALRRLDRHTESRKCYKTAVDALLYAMKIDNVEAALSFEILIHRAFVSTIEDEAHYYRCYSDWRDAMARFGRRFRDANASMSQNASGIAFVLPSGSLLGHTEVLFNLLSEKAVLKALGVTPRIYVMYETYDDFLERAAKAGVDVFIAMRELPDGFHATELSRLAWLRNKLHEHDCGVAIWVTAPPSSIFMLAAGIAPVQIFWALRFHPISGPFIDGYITYGPRHRETETFGKIDWQVCPVPLAIDMIQHGKEAITDVRRTFPQCFLMGTLAREEKIDSKPFLETVVRILKDNPEAGYLWTGRKRHPGIQQVFDSAGVADRCHFIGWVDTMLYAQALDLFLETFPLGCGITGYQALGSGIPVLSYLEKNTLFGMQFGIDAPTRGEEWADTQFPILCARNPQDYVEYANRLIADSEFRNATAARGKAFFEREVNNGEYYTRRFFGTVGGIADATLSMKNHSATTPS